MVKLLITWINVLLTFYCYKWIVKPGGKEQKRKNISQHNSKYFKNSAAGLILPWLFNKHTKAWLLLFSFLFFQSKNIFSKQNWVKSCVGLNQNWILTRYTVRKVEFTLDTRRSSTRGIQYTSILCISQRVEKYIYMYMYTRLAIRQKN